MKDFTQQGWDEAAAAAWEELLRLAVREDLERLYDWTTVALVASAAQGAARVVARRAGVAAGLAAAPRTLDEYDRALEWQPMAVDGEHLQAGQPLGRIEGPARGILTSERVLLNLLGRLSGIATLTRRYVEAVAGTRARIYDTRKTTPGWRVLEKYAVTQGGGHNHRLGLYDAVLIKDNHLALRSERHAGGAAQAVRDARAFVDSMAAGPMIVEVEVDSLAQLADALDAGPDVVLLDNFKVDALREAVALRDVRRPGTPLEASGGVSLDSVRAIAETGVDRISVGALTHSAPWLDIALDWE